MKAFRDLAEDFIETLRRENAQSQKRIDEFEATGMRVSERPFGGSWSDVTDREVALLKHDISSRLRTITRLEEELRVSS